MKKTVSLAQSAVLMGVIILLSKALGLARDILVASAYGTTMEAVAYGTASKLPTTVFDFILGGVVTSAFIPVYNRIAVQRGKDEAVGFAQSYVNLILLITTTLSVLGVVFAPSLVRLIAPELAPETAALAASLTRIMFPMVIFVGLAFSFVGFLQSEGEYNIPALISLVSNLLMVGYLLFLNDRFGVRGLSAAMLAGWAAQALVQLPAVLKRGFRPRLSAPLGTPEIARAAKNTLPILVATWTTPVCNLINTRFASGIEGGRAITALDYANRLYIILVGLFSFVATNLLFPYFARAAASGDTEESDRRRAVHRAGVRERGLHVLRHGAHGGGAADVRDRHGLRGVRGGAGEGVLRGGEDAAADDRLAHFDDGERRGGIRGERAPRRAVRRRGDRAAVGLGGGREHGGESRLRVPAGADPARSVGLGGHCEERPRGGAHGRGGVVCGLPLRRDGKDCGGRAPDAHRGGGVRPAGDCPAERRDEADSFENPEELTDRYERTRKGEKRPRAFFFWIFSFCLSPSFCLRADACGFGILQIHSFFVLPDGT